MNRKGFTLLELLIVIAILAVLAAVAIFVLNPAETLREARDAQRVSDLATLKTAIALYLTKTPSPQLDNTSANTTCYNGSGTDTIYYSYSTDSGTITDATLDGGTGGSIAPGQTSTASSSLVNGTGWIPVNLASLIGGSPISDMPRDPTNTIGDVANITNTGSNPDLVYRYVCDTDITFEMNAVLESQAFSGRMTTDGGNNTNVYEVGTKLGILGTGTDF